MNLFAAAEQRRLAQVQPLAARMRPRTLAEFLGQRHLLDDTSLLTTWMRRREIGPLVLCGPPGCGKTTLARLLAANANYEMRQLNAISTGVKDIREVLEESRERIASGDLKILLFVDELHRLHRGQQEVMLRELEDGVIAFIGATTSNPFFTVSSALLSRSQVMELRPLDPADLVELLERTVADRERGLGPYDWSVAPNVFETIASISDGDARRSLQILECAAMLSGEEHNLTVELVQRAAQRKAGSYDRSGDEHYDLASALIKSLRGSDPDAAIYWLARMLEAGEDVRFLCRRLVILASEDIGNADPQALSVAVAAMQACEFVGLPECQYALAQATTYLACAPKSNAATRAVSEARRDVREAAIVPVPQLLRDPNSTVGRRDEANAAYHSPHLTADGIVAADYLGVDRIYYDPLPRGFELELQQRLNAIRSQLGKSSSAES